MNRTFFLDTEFPLRDPFRWFLLALLLGIILPLGFDTDLVIQIKHYTLRVNYLAHAFLLLCFLGLGFKSPYPLNYVSFFKRNIELWCFLALGLTGIVSVFSSENFSRSVFFWIWSLGTLLTMKYVVAGLKNRLGIWPLRLLCIYWLAYSGIVIWDFSVCSLGWCFLKIGRVVDYWRPHGWYYEPSYFAGMGLYMILCFLVWRNLEEKPAFSWAATLGLFTSFLVVLCSTSRLGIVGLALLAFILISKQIRGWSFFRALRPVKILVAASVFIIFVAFSPFQKSLSSFLRIKTDGSFSERLSGMKASWDVFKARPWFGVGPGASGAFFIKHFNEHPYRQMFQSQFLSEHKDRMKAQGRVGGDAPDQTPLGHSVWLEVLSEWGMIGFSFYLMGMLLMFFSSNKNPIALGMLAVLFCNNLLSQTLPRYDLWFALSVLVVYSAGVAAKPEF